MYSLVPDTARYSLPSPKLSKSIKQVADEYAKAYREWLKQCLVKLGINPNKSVKEIRQEIANRNIYIIVHPDREELWEEDTHIATLLTKIFNVNGTS